MSAVPLPGLVPALHRVQRIPGTRLVLLAFKNADDPGAGDGLVLDRDQARALARELAAAARPHGSDRRARAAGPGGRRRATRSQ